MSQLEAKTDVVRTALREAHTAAAASVQGDPEFLAINTGLHAQLESENATIPRTPNRTPRWRFTPDGLTRPNGAILFGIRSAWALSKQSLSGDPTS